MQYAVSGLEVRHGLVPWEKPHWPTDVDLTPLFPVSEVHTHDPNL